MGMVTVRPSAFRAASAVLTLRIDHTEPVMLRLPSCAHQPVKGPPQGLFRAQRFDLRETNRRKERGKRLWAHHPSQQNFYG